MSETSATTAGPELVITRVFDAPRELVFAAWTDPEQFRVWSVPTNFVVTHAEGDVRPGGAWRSAMRSDEWGELWLHGVWLEVAPPERLSFTTAWETDDGSPDHEMLITVTFTDVDGKTKMRFHQAAFIHEQSRDSHRDGWSECFDNLDSHLAGVTT
jgi:uncharacterized protein YndB with AHSA1/START domain